MPKKIVFLNMSDDLGVDGHKAVTALRIKNPSVRFKNYHVKKTEQVTEIDMVDFYRAFTTGAHYPDFGTDRTKIKNLCQGATQVMLSIHGPMTSVNYGLIRSTLGRRPDEHVSYQQLANLLLTLFVPNVQYNFSLVMCFGARSSNYRLDHENLDLIDWTDSFAYKLYQRISPNRSVRMTARTGELSFNTVTGKSEVQTELAIQGTLDNQAISQEVGVIQSIAWWNQNRNLFLNAGGAKANFVIALVTAEQNTTAADKLTALRALRRNHGLPAHDYESRELLNYLRQKIRLVEASGRQNSGPQGKYGKLVYKYIYGMGNVIFAKYPNPVCVHPKHLGHGTPVSPRLLKKFAK
ncbi:hypothetical protein [Thalassomonas actiniarum]|uniref:Uncharacterized protein n=1 Tax=Thalassomonas actiniarum TaxID=485447 RepID=A0AAE9YQK6_9GAMM|nr:hypothetical protein [Thalassomonas actiniarum]WDD98448.1 hypothetical protein SG35_024840 [Thalassomonas actiniarum]